MKPCPSSKLFSPRRPKACPHARNTLLLQRLTLKLASFPQNHHTAVPPPSNGFVSSPATPFLPSISLPKWVRFVFLTHAVPIGFVPSKRFGLIPTPSPRPLYGRA